MSRFPSSESKVRMTSAQHGGENELKERGRTELIVLFGREGRRPEFGKHRRGRLEGVHQELSVLFNPTRRQ
jgi:hypothetical protein